MGARGPQPLPTAIKKQRGTFQPCRAASNEAAPLGKPICPAWMTDKDAKKEFRRLVKILLAMGLVGASDSNLLTRYAVTWVRWRRVVQTLAANSGAEFATVKDETGAVKSLKLSALHHAERSLSDELSRAEAALGLSPSSRSRIEVSMTPAAAEPEARFFDDFSTRN